MSTPFLHFINAVRVTADDGAASGTPSTSDLAQINGRVALVEQRAEEIFVWSFVISTNLVDSYGTWMDRSSLENYKRQANEGRGVPYLRHHDTWQDEMGRVFRGKLVEGDVVEPTAGSGVIPLARDVFRKPEKERSLIETTFTRRDLEGAGDLIARLESGIAASNSIGFDVYTPASPGSMLECDICGIDLFTRSSDGGFFCPHMPRVVYEVARGSGDDAETVTVMATARVVNATQREASGVYLGATPGTFTLADRAAALFDAGKLGKREARAYEEMHQLTRGYIVGGRQAHFDMRGAGKTNDDDPTTAVSVAADADRAAKEPPAAAGAVAGEDTRGAGGTHREESGGMTQAIQTEEIDRVRAALKGDQDRLAALELVDTADPIAALYRIMADEVVREKDARVAAEGAVDAVKRKVGERIGAEDGEDLTAAIDRVMALAKLGEGARGRLVDELIRQMTRAGLAFDEAAQKKIAERLAPEEIEAQTAMFKATADSRLSPGRVSEPSLEHRNGGAPAARPDPSLSAVH